MKNILDLDFIIGFVSALICIIVFNLLRGRKQKNKKSKKTIKSQYDGVSYELYPGNDYVWPVLWGNYKGINNGQVLSFFMQTDGTDFYKEIKKILDDIINNRVKFDEWVFNLYEVQFNKDNIKITDVIDETQDECIINTDMFSLLLDEYYQLYQNIKYKRLNIYQICEEIVKLIPEHKDVLNKFLEENDNKLLGHLYFGDEFNSRLITLLDNYTEKDKIKKYCDFIEYMWKKGNKDVKNIVDVTILERLSDDNNIWKKFGQNISNEFKEYINNELIPNNEIMNHVNKL